MTPGGDVIIRDTLFRDVGQLATGGRPARTLSIYSTRNHFRCERVDIDKSMQDRNTGAFAFQGQPGFDREITISGLRVFCTHLEQPMGSVGMEISSVPLAKVTFEGCHFEAESGMNWIEINEDEPGVEFHDCTGNTSIKRRKKGGPVIAEVGHVGQNGTF